MENGNQVAKIDQKELILNLQVFDSTSTVEDIKRLLENNHGDFVSVMNILKEKNIYKQNMIKRNKKIMSTGNTLKQKIYEKLRLKKEKEKETFEERECISEEKTFPRLQQIPVEPDVNKEELINRIMICNSKEDVQQVVAEFAQGYNNTVKKLKTSNLENFILKMGICQRRKITQEEIKKRLEVEGKLRDTKLKLDRLVQSQDQLQQSINLEWMQNHFGKEGF